MLLQFLPVWLSLFFPLIFFFPSCSQFFPFPRSFSYNFLAKIYFIFCHFLFTFFMPYWFHFFTILSSYSSLGNTDFPCLAVIFVHFFPHPSSSSSFTAADAFPLLSSPSVSFRKQNLVLLMDFLFFTSARKLNLAMLCRASNRFYTA
jgi:hypothetical protein